MKEPGWVYLVGAGPGDPGLITARGAFLLGCCDCIIYDHLASEELLAYGRQGCERLYVGKQKGVHAKSQEEINRLLVEKAWEHSAVVRLKGGDPYIFGRGGEEALALMAAGIPFETVPGVTSASAVLAAAGIPLTHRGVSRSFHVVTGHGEEGGGLPEDFYRLKGCGGTVVVLMGASRLEEICQGLKRQGWAAKTPAAVIQDGTLPAQRRISGTLEEIGEKAKAAGIGAPAVFVAGETAAFRLLSEAGRPLAGVRVGMVGTPWFTGRLKGLLESKGAGAKEVCRMELIPCRDTGVEESFGKLSSYTWLVFTSGNGVRLYFDQLLESRDWASGRKRDLRSLGGIKIAAMGKGTSGALKEYCIRADYVPDAFNSESLTEGLLARLSTKDRVLIPRAGKGSRKLPDGLRKAGIPFFDLPLYQLRPAFAWGGAPGAGASLWPGAKGLGMAEGKGRQEYDFLVFASASGVDAFFSAGLSPGNAKVCCIGEATALALASHGFRADGIPKEASAEGIVEEITRMVSH